MASHPKFPAALFATLFAASLFTPFTAFAGPAEDAARQRVSELKRQLGQGPNATAWGKFLRLSELDAQLAAGPNANRAAVESLLARFSGAEKGLDWKPIVALRQSLEAWLDSFPPPPVAELPKLLREAKSQYTGRNPADVDVARREVRAAADQLNRYLSRGPQGPGWRAFLYLDALDAQLKSATPDLAELRGIQRQFVSGKVGLELPIFANVGRTLSAYVDRQATADSPQVREEYAKQLEALADGLEKLAKEPTTNVTAAYEWLTAADQARPLLAAVRHYYSRPNLRVEISEALMASGANREVDDVSPVYDNILGTDIRGTGRTRGRILLDIIPDQRRAVYELLFSGNVLSNTVGRNGPAVIHSRGGTAFSARKRILLDSNGISQYDTQTAARTSTTTTGVGVTIRIPIVKKFAQKMAAQQVQEKKGQGEWIGARHAEVRISNRFDNQVGIELSKAHQKFQDLVVLPARRYGRAPDQLRFSSSDTSVYVVGLHANRQQLAAPIDPPAIVGGSDLALRLHESTVNNIGEAIAGQTWQDQKLKQELSKVIEIPKKWEPESGEEKEPGTITFADEKPLTLVVADGGFALTIRAQGFTRGEEAFEGMEISVAYKFDKTDAGIVARRSGEIRIRPPGFVQGKDKLSLGQTTLVKLLEKTFGKIFSEELKTEIELKGDPAKVGKLVATSHSAEKGWVALDWRQVTTGRVAAQPRKVAAND